jgi:hypothetical protein
VDRGFRAAQAGRDLLEGRMNMRPFERDSFSLWLQRTLSFLSLYELLWLGALTLAAGGWLWLTYYAKRRQALDEERPLPDFPVAALACTLLIAAAALMVGLKAASLWRERATIVADKAEARSLPTDDGVSLFSLNGGAEVLVKRRQGGWTQVQNSDGGSGWVKDGDLYITSER